MKKIFVLNVIIFFIFCNICVWADDDIENVEMKDIDKVIETASYIENNVPKISSNYAVVLDRKSKAVIYGKNEKDKTKMASTTKIMTAIVVIENTNLNNIVEISSKAAGTGGSKLKIKICYID